MRISTKGRYSLEALLYMTLLPDDVTVNTKTIAEHIEVSDGYLEQLFIPLRKAGIIEGIRGPLGGYRPGRSLDSISVGEVLRTVEGPLEPVNCIITNDCPIQDICASKSIWCELYEEIKTCVDSISLKDLADAYDALDKMEYSI
jgi:Rrf2 family protein